MILFRGPSPKFDVICRMHRLRRHKFPRNLKASPRSTVSRGNYIIPIPEGETSVSLIPVDYPQNTKLPIHHPHAHTRYKLFGYTNPLLIAIECRAASRAQFMQIASSLYRKPLSSRTGGDFCVNSAMWYVKLTLECIQ